MSMKPLRTTSLLAAVAIIFTLALLPLFGTASVAFAQDVPLVETFTPTPTASSTPTPTETSTSTSTSTETSTTTATATSTFTGIPPITPIPPPVPIPEPVTVVLLGTGLAALSAAVAARRRR